MYLTLTDNFSYLVFVKCWSDGEMSWQVMSTTKTLPTKDQKEIRKHLKVLGLAKKEHLLIKQNYTNCKLDKGKTEL